MDGGIVLAIAVCSFCAGILLATLVSSGNLDVNMGVAAKAGSFVHDGKTYLVTPAKAAP